MPTRRHGIVMGLLFVRLTLNAQAQTVTDVNQQAQIIKRVRPYDLKTDFTVSVALSNGQ
jgi:hypothetical protein